MDDAGGRDSASRQRRDRILEASEPVADRLLCRAHPGGRPRTLVGHSPVPLDELPDRLEGLPVPVFVEGRNLVIADCELAGVVLMPPPWVHKLDLRFRHKNHLAGILDGVDKLELIRTMREAHQRLVRTIEGVPDERLLEPAMDDWTGKDLLAHMACWPDHSVRVIEGLRAGRQPYDGNDPANSTAALNEQVHREHLDDSPELTRRAFSESFIRLLAALEPVTDEELFADDRWPWLGGEALAEMILWDSSRHYEAHREYLQRLSR